MAVHIREKVHLSMVQPRLFNLELNLKQLKEEIQNYITLSTLKQWLSTNAGAVLSSFELHYRSVQVVEWSSRPASDHDVPSSVEYRMPLEA